MQINENFQHFIYQNEIKKFLDSVILLILYLFIIIFFNEVKCSGFLSTAQIFYPI